LIREVKGEKRIEYGVPVTPSNVTAKEWFYRKI